MSDLKDRVISEIKKIYDPEIPVNIYELGLIYKIEIDDDKKVDIEMFYKSISDFEAMFHEYCGLFYITSCIW